MIDGERVDLAMSGGVVSFLCQFMVNGSPHLVWSGLAVGIRLAVGIGGHPGLVTCETGATSSARLVPALYRMVILLGISLRRLVY